MSLRSIFLAVIAAAALVVAAFLVNQRRPAVERGQPTPALVAATGKCAGCHQRETSAVVHERERSKHAAKGISSLDCHQPVAGQAGTDHRGFTISTPLTAKNCAQCHATEHGQFALSRHAAPAWASVGGPTGMTAEQRALGEKHHPGWVERAPMAIGAVEGPSAVTSGRTARPMGPRPRAGRLRRQLRPLGARPRPERLLSRHRVDPRGVRGARHRHPRCGPRDAWHDASAVHARCDGSAGHRGAPRVRPPPRGRLAAGVELVLSPPPERSSAPSPTPHRRRDRRPA